MSWSWFGWVPKRASSRAASLLFKSVPFVFGGLILAGIITMAVGLGLAFADQGQVYEWSSPLDVVWIGIGTLWISVLYVFWWVLLWQRFTKAGHIFACIVAVLFGILGFVNLVAFAAGQNTAAASVLSLLWIGTGAYAAACSVVWIQTSGSAGKESLVPLDDVDDSPDEGRLGSCSCSCCRSIRCRNCCSGCCTGRNWIIGFGLFTLIFAAVFCIGATVQAVTVAANSNAYPPAGTVYSVTVDGVGLSVHMHCRGGPSATTILFEHGGGSNSLAGEGMAMRLIESGRRVCTYDRLGYGWTPSLYQRPSISVASGGNVTLALLRSAAEPGPFVCVGHSAGATSCLNFAMAANGTEVQVAGVVLLDGYPDLIRAGTLRPGQDQGVAAKVILDQLKGFSVIAGPTGLSSGQLGTVDGQFEPASVQAAYRALYTQTRFWLSQYFDVRADLEDRDRGAVYARLPGAYQDGDGLFHYANNFPFHVVVMPAWTTVNSTCLPGSTEYCCGSYGRDSDICVRNRIDSALYFRQAQLYTTLGTSGRLIVAPEGSTHSYPYTTPYVEWLVRMVSEEFP